MSQSILADPYRATTDICDITTLCLEDVFSILDLTIKQKSWRCNGSVNQPPYQFGPIVVTFSALLPIFRAFIFTALAILNSNLFRPSCGNTLSDRASRLLNQPGHLDCCSIET